MSENNSSGVRSIERALKILDCYTNGKDSYSLIEISEMVSLSPSTALRILSTLADHNYLYRNKNNLRYYLGFKLSQLSNTALYDLDIRRIARPYLEDINDTFGESVGLYLLQKKVRVCIERIEGKRILRHMVMVGDVNPLNVGASGKVLLAYQKPDFIADVVNGNKKLEQDLDNIRKSGYAISYGEREPGVISVACPIFNSKYEVNFALFMTAAEANIKEEMLPDIVKSLKKASGEISVSLGASKEDIKDTEAYHLS